MLQVQLPDFFVVQVAMQYFQLWRQCPGPSAGFHYRFIIAPTKGGRNLLRTVDGLQGPVKRSTARFGDMYGD
jgi:hypothetical protein